MPNLKDDTFVDSTFELDPNGKMGFVTSDSITDWNDIMFDDPLNITFTTYLMKLTNNNYQYGGRVVDCQAFIGDGGRFIPQILHTTSSIRCWNNGNQGYVSMPNYFLVNTNWEAIALRQEVEWLPGTGETRMKTSVSKDGTTWYENENFDGTPIASPSGETFILGSFQAGHRWTTFLMSSKIDTDQEVSGILTIMNDNLKPPI